LDEEHVKMIFKGKTPPAVCDDGKGASPSAANPEADPGYLCVFVGEDTGAEPPGVFGIDRPEDFQTAGAGRTGFGIVAAVPLAEERAWSGTFAVTAP
jgi:hypothetical protein